jgi:hypothetical protein
VKLTKRHIEVLGLLIGWAQDQHHDAEQMGDEDFLGETFGTSPQELDAVDAALAELRDGAGTEQQPYITLDEKEIEYVILDGEGRELWRGDKRGGRDAAEAALADVVRNSAPPAD